VASPPIIIQLPLPDGARPLRLVHVDAGDSVLGLPPDEPTADPEERRVRSTLTRGFWIGETPVTVSEWRAVGISLAAELDETDPDMPITGVTWEEARRFCQRLPAEGIPKGYRFDLPTEQQWEHACRAGTSTRYFFGDADDELEHYAFFGDTTDGARPRPVAQKRASPLGLYDMLGNVAEWCLDTPADYDDPSVDRAVRSPGALRCVRGGTFRSGEGEGQLLCGRRGWMDRSMRRPWQGFRVALVPDVVA
jgi:formylglycine-generating enzyme required for sulfatase activity